MTLVAWLTGFVLGAVLAGGDWGRGTITTSLLAGSGRLRTGAGQALALAVAVTASVAATFAVSAAASLLFRALEAGEVNPIDGAMPPTWVLLRAMGAALLVALTYAALGWLLGTACRSAAGGIALALVWAVLIETYVSYFGFDYTGLLPRVSDFLPGTNAITLTGLFGDVGGGPASQNLLPDRPAIAAWALAGWAAAFVALTLVLLHRRDVLAGRVRRRRRRPAALTRPQAAVDTAMPPRRAGGVAASVRAELLVQRHRPVLWWLVLAVPVNMLITGYLNDYVNYQNAGNGAPGSSGTSGPLMPPSVLPVQYLTTALSRDDADIRAGRRRRRGVRPGPGRYRPPGRHPLPAGRGLRHPQAEHHLTGAAPAVGQPAGPTSSIRDLVPCQVALVALPAASPGRNPEPDPHQRTIGVAWATAMDHRCRFRAGAPGTGVPGEAGGVRGMLTLRRA